MYSRFIRRTINLARNTYTYVVRAKLVYPFTVVWVVFSRIAYSHTSDDSPLVCEYKCNDYASWYLIRIIKTSSKKKKRKKEKEEMKRNASQINQKHDCKATPRESLSWEFWLDLWMLNALHLQVHPSLETSLWSTRLDNTLTCRFNYSLVCTLGGSNNYLPADGSS